MIFYQIDSNQRYRTAFKIGLEIQRLGTIPARNPVVKWLRAKVLHTVLFTYKGHFKLALFG